jgi:hypothetical protein
MFKFKKVLFIACALALTLALGAAAAYADGGEDEEKPLLGFDDGRLNAFDFAQPVAVYYSYDSKQLVDDDGNPYWADVVDGIELWAADSDGIGQLVLYAPIESIEAALASGVGTQIAAANGYTLSYLPATNMFCITTPTWYTFTWEAWD